MENSSYSKTRSLKNFLAWLLLFAILIVAMPVLPVGADEKNIANIEFEGVIGSEDYFLDTDSYKTNKTIAFLDDLQNDGKWGNFDKLSVQKTESDVKITGIKLTQQFGNKTTSKPFNFGVIWNDVSEGKNIYISVDDGLNWRVLESSGIYRIDDYGLEASLYSITDSLATGAAQTIKVKGDVPPQKHIVSFTGEGAASWSMKLDSVTALNGSQLSVEEKEKYELVISNVPQSEKPDIHAEPEVNVDLDGGSPTLDPKTGKYTYKYTIGKIQADTVLTISKAANNVQLQFSQSPNPHFDVDVPGLNRETEGNEASVNVVKGGDYTFTVTRDEDYKEPTVTIQTADLEEPATWTKFTKNTNGLSTVYKLYGVDKDLYISIADAGQMQSSVEYHLPEGATVKVGEDDSSQATELTYGTHDIEITIPVAYSNSVVSATVNGVAIVLKQKLPDAGDGSKTYTGSITVNSPTTVIVVNGVQKNTYTVTIALSEKYTVQGNSSVSVAYGENAVFTLLLAEG